MPIDATLSGATWRICVVLTRRVSKSYTNILVVPQNERLFQEALELYLQRVDKAWSLTDCSSFLIMQEMGLTEALAHDKHFSQAGFVALLGGVE